MADTWGSIGFTVLASGLTRSRAARLTVTPIPGGTISYIDYGGASLPQVNYDLLLTEVAYGSLEAAVGGTAALVSATDGTITCAALQTVTRRQRIPASGQTFAAATWVVVTL